MLYGLFSVYHRCCELNGILGRPGLKWLCNLDYVAEPCGFLNSFMDTFRLILFCSCVRKKIIDSLNMYNNVI